MFHPLFQNPNGTNGPIGAHVQKHAVKANREGRELVPHKSRNAGEPPRSKRPRLKLAKSRNVRVRKQNSTVQSKIKLIFS